MTSKMLHVWNRSNTFREVAKNARKPAKIFWHCEHEWVKIKATVSPVVETKSCWKKVWKCQKVIEIDWPRKNFLSFFLELSLCTFCYILFATILNYSEIIQILLYEIKSVALLLFPSITLKKVFKEIIAKTTMLCCSASMVAYITEFFSCYRVGYLRMTMGEGEERKRKAVEQKRESNDCFQFLLVAGFYQLQIFT